MAKHDNLLVGLDIGTTKICVIVGEVEEKRIDIIGIGTHPSKGLKKGMVVNIDSTVESVKRAVEEAEMMAGVEINSVYTGIAGGHIQGFNGRGVIAVKEGEITRGDIERVLEAAKVVSIPADREILHVIPQEYIVDGQDGIRDPFGMSGTRLEVCVHIITGAVTSAQNIVKCVKKAGLDTMDVILQPLASSEAVLTPEEKDLGVLVIDIGGGTTDMAIFVEGAVRHTAVLPIGGNHLTNDIAIGLRTPPHEAEKLKIRYGCALTEMVKENETVEVPGVGGRPPRIMSRQLLSEVIEPRAEEIFTLAAAEIEKAGFEDKVPSGVVLTGGTSLTPGMVELCEQILNLPTRLGVPSNLGGLIDIVRSPIYATGVGLLLYAHHNQERKMAASSKRGGFINRIKEKMKEWAKEFF
ncbi:MAG: cell division protein FtsA [Nitrospirae bacterium]|nr:cell division protein FtsA [Candidatus Troglogloeales bacterium]MBI3598015.1 cell division protein FtsA [Candidatus Troglogloeales bacterium]